MRAAVRVADVDAGDQVRGEFETGRHGDHGATTG
jgi:hypothetical protein